MDVEDMVSSTIVRVPISLADQIFLIVQVLRQPGLGLNHPWSHLPSTLTILDPTIQSPHETHPDPSYRQRSHRASWTIHTASASHTRQDTRLNRPHIMSGSKRHEHGSSQTHGERTMENDPSFLPSWCFAAASLDDTRHDLPTKRLAHLQSTNPARIHLYQIPHLSVVKNWITG